MNNRNFPSHGDLALSVEGQLLIIEGEGPANLEMVLTYQKNVLAYREQIMSKPWASLVLLRGTPMVSPESSAILSETIKQAKMMHLQATAVVFVNIEYEETIKRYWEQIYDGTGVNYQFFESQADARRWLHDILANA